MDTLELNIFAIVAAALANFVIGGLWYSPALFGGAWMRANGFKPADLEQGSPAVWAGRRWGSASSRCSSVVEHCTC